MQRATRHHGDTNQFIFQEHEVHVASRTDNIDLNIDYFGEIKKERNIFL
jgi:hypothetical protein